MCGAQRFQPIVGVSVANAFGLQRFRSVDRRGVQQSDDRALERAIERAGHAKLPVRLFDARLERGVQLRRARGVDRGVAIAVARVDEGAAVTRDDAERRRGMENLHVSRRRGAVGDVGDDNGEVSDQAVGRQPRHDGGAFGECLDEGSDERVARIERRERERISFAAERHRGRRCRRGGSGSGGAGWGRLPPDEDHVCGGANRDDQQRDRTPDPIGASGRRRCTFCRGVTQLEVGRIRHEVLLFVQHPATRAAAIARDHVGTGRVPFGPNPCVGIGVKLQKQLGHLKIASQDGHVEGTHLAASQVHNLRSSF